MPTVRARLQDKAGYGRSRSANRNMNATPFPGFPRMLKAVAGPLAALGLLMSLQACGAPASATTAQAGTTPASAMRTYDSSMTAAKVAQADHNELLALSLTTSAEYALVSAAYTAGTGVGSASADRPVYGRPTLYVPKLTTYPQWFMAMTPQHPAKGGPARTSLMVFYRASSGSAWQLSGSVLLNPGTARPTVATGHDGYATALPTNSQSLKISPDEVGATDATVADDGPSSAATAVVAAGPQTTGLYSTNAAIKKQAAARHEFYQWEMEGTSYPVFALRTADGGALVFYTMYLNTVTEATNEPPRHSHAPLPTVPVPAEYQPFLPSKTGTLHHQLTGDQTLQYAALVPPASSKTGKIQVIGSAGGPTYAHGF